MHLRSARDTYGILTTNLGFNAITSEDEQEAIAKEAPIPKTPTETVEVSE